MSELKACPFCGREATKFLSGDDGMVGCMACCVSQLEKTHRDTNWNTRPIEEALQKQLSDLRVQLKEAVREMRQDIDLHSERNPLSGCYGVGLNQAIRILRKHNLIEEEL